MIRCLAKTLRSMTKPVIGEVSVRFFSGTPDAVISAI
jgi:hypothetical protein